MKLPVPKPICLTCEVCLDEYALPYHRGPGHKIEYSDCMHPFIEGMSDKISPLLWCACDCENCLEKHR